MTILAARPRDALADYGRRLDALDLDGATVVAAAAAEIEHLDGRRPDRPELLRRLEERWYGSLISGSPDFGVYADRGYLAEAFACWRVYSRRYVAALDRTSEISGVDRIVDVGCGIGYSTAALAEIYPSAEVVGTNLDGTEQTAVARSLGVAVVPDVAGLGEVDLVFASEYFEHFERPIEHLWEILTALRPRILAVANTFGAPSIGHFPRYVVDGALLDGPATSRRFGSALRRIGYRKAATTFWNGRPTVWLRP